MALPELVANSPTPGTVAPITTLSAAMTDTTGLSMSTVAAAPAALRAATGQFHVVVDSEIMLVAASASGASPWTVLTRGAEGSTAATHLSGASVFHYLTAGALAALIPTVPAIDVTAADFQMDGTAAAGATGKVADAGHVHPSDTSRLASARIQVLRASAGAFTASQSRDVAFTWPIAFADTNYTMTAALVDTANTANNSALRSVQVLSASGFTVRIGSGTVGYTAGQLLVHAIGIHD